MKKGKGRVSRIVLVVFGLLTIGSAGMMANAAGNITNEDFTYDWIEGPQDVWSDVTRTRSKLDDTSSMMACEGGPSYTASVYAVSDDGYSYYDASGGHSYAFTANSSTYMINYVYENGYHKAAIVGYLSSSPSFGHPVPSFGFWSPDSI